MAYLGVSIFRPEPETVDRIFRYASQMYRSQGTPPQKKQNYIRKAHSRLRSQVQVIRHLHPATVIIAKVRSTSSTVQRVISNMNKGCMESHYHDPARTRECVASLRSWWGAAMEVP